MRTGVVHLGYIFTPIFLEVAKPSTSLASVFQVHDDEAC